MTADFRLLVFDKTYKKAITILLGCFLIPQFLFAEEPNERLDSLQQRYRMQRVNGELANAMLTNNKAIDVCIENGLKDELASAYLTAANVLSNLSRFEESFDHLDRALNVSEISNPVILQARACAGYGRNYSGLGFYASAEESYNEGLNWALQIKDTRFRKRLAVYLYGLRAMLFEKQSRYSKSLNDLHAAFSLSREPLLASRIAKHYTVFDWNKDSATFYLQEAARLFAAGQFPVYQKSIVLRNHGRYFLKTNEFDKAFEKLAASIEISKLLAKPLDLLRTYELINEVAAESENTSLQRIALQEMRKLDDSLSSLKRRAVEIPLNQAKQYYVQKANERMYLWSLAALTVLLLGLFLYIRLRKTKGEQIQEKMDEFAERTVELENMLDVNQVDLHNKIVEMAKENDPDFLNSFTHLYPEFINKLKEIDPHVRNSELSFCAMTFLDLTSKEIAVSTFVTTRAVQIRKNRLRKKHQIDSAIDFNVWMRGLVYVDDERSI